MGSSSGGKSNSSNNWGMSQTIPQFQSDALTKLFSTADKLYGNMLPKINAAVPSAQNTINTAVKSVLPAFKTSLQGGTYSPTNATNVIKGINTSIAIPSQTSKIYSQMMGGNGNTYANAMKAAFAGDARRASDNMLGALDTRAAAAGMSGGARHGIATSQGMYDINSNLQKNLADVGYSTFDKNLQDKLGIAQQADANTLQRQQMLVDMLGQKQNTINSGMNFGSQIQNLGMGTFAPISAPWNTMKNYAATLGNPVVLSNGSGSGESKGSGKGGSFMGG